MSEETRSKLIGISVAVLCVIAILGLVFWATPTDSDDGNISPQVQSGTPSGILNSDEDVAEFESPEDVPLYDVLKVGDKVYTSRDLVDRTNSLLKRSGMNMAMMGSEYAGYKVEVLNYWASELAIPLIAEKNGITVSDEEFNTEKETMISNYGGNEVFQEALKTAGETEEAFNETLRLNILSSKVMEISNIDTNVTDEEIQKYYEDNKDRMVTESHCDLYIIQCNTDEELNTAKQRLDAGDSWDTVAAEFNILTDETTTVNNGFGGTVVWSELKTEVSEAIVKAGWGKHTDIITVDNGDGSSIKVIMKGENFEESHKILLEEAKEDIRQVLIEQKLSTGYIDFIEGQYEELGIKILVTEADIAKKEAK